MLHRLTGLIFSLLIFLFCGTLFGQTVDYAVSDYRQSWTHHPVFGDPSFDTFERLSGNPVCRGNKDFGWPVNGSLFKDPVSSDWYLYVGWYKTGYAITKDRCHCIAYRSSDRGLSWKMLGNPIAGFGTHIFEGEVSPIGAAPEVAVYFKDDRYHMSFDWTTKDYKRESVFKPSPEANVGAAYAVSDSPQGPFQPVTAYAKTRENSALLGKYKRLYASTLLPRKKDYIALTLTDSQNYYGWGLVGQTAPKPEGQWTKPRLILHPQLDRYFPQLLEFFPAFIHDGFIYAPATSVATNRNYQLMFRVPVEKAMDPDAWQIYQEGSIWHSEPVESEYEGIWGQTFSGFIESDGTFYVMFPSRDADNKGTINLASRPWNRPLRKRGFVISAHSAASMSILRHDTLLNRLNAQLKVHGTVKIIWNHHGPFGPGQPKANCGLHPLMRRHFDCLELSTGSWRLLKYNKNGGEMEIAAGKLRKSIDRSVVLALNGKKLRLKIDGSDCWSGLFDSGKGRVGLWLEPRSNAKVDRFEVEGIDCETAMNFLYTEALQCAAQNMKDWQEIKNNDFYYGRGVISKSDSVEAKWNFIGNGFALWAPTGAKFGKAQLLLDGKFLTEIDFSSNERISSHRLYEKRNLPLDRHCIKLKVICGPIPVDVLQVFDIGDLSGLTVVNTAPSVYAGGDRTVYQDEDGNTVSLDAEVSDDGMPEDPGIVKMNW